MTTPLGTTAATSRGARDLDTVALGALAQIALGALGKGGADASYGSLKQGLREAAARDPMDAVLATVLGGTYLFYLAEKGKNPRVTSFWDALVFITTCLSVGYDNVFARTDAGKAVASFVMTFGPALTARIFEPPAGEKPEAAPAASPESVGMQKEILARLDGILAALQKTPPPAG